MTHQCDEGWICEQHPDQPWPHGYTREDPKGCAGPGMMCMVPDCEYWIGGQLVPTMYGEGYIRIVREEDPEWKRRHPD